MDWPISIITTSGETLASMSQLLCSVLETVASIVPDKGGHATGPISGVVFSGPSNSKPTLLGQIRIKYLLRLESPNIFTYPGLPKFDTIDDRRGSVILQNWFCCTPALHVILYELKDPPDQEWTGVTLKSVVKWSLSLTLTTHRPVTIFVTPFYQSESKQTLTKRQKSELEDAQKKVKKLVAKHGLDGVGRGVASTQARDSSTSSSGMSVFDEKMVGMMKNGSNGNGQAGGGLIQGGVCELNDLSLFVTQATTRNGRSQIKFSDMSDRIRAALAKRFKSIGDALESSAIPRSINDTTLGQGLGSVPKDGTGLKANVVNAFSDIISTIKWGFLHFSVNLFNEAIAQFQRAITILWGLVGDLVLKEKEGRVVVDQDGEESYVVSDLFILKNGSCMFSLDPIKTLDGLFKVLSDTPLALGNDMLDTYPSSLSSQGSSKSYNGKHRSSVTMGNVGQIMKQQIDKFGLGKVPGDLAGGVLTPSPLADSAREGRKKYVNVFNLTELLLSATLLHMNRRPELLCHGLDKFGLNVNKATDPAKRIQNTLSNIGSSCRIGPVDLWEYVMYTTPCVIIKQFFKSLEAKMTRSSDDKQQAGQRRKPNDKHPKPTSQDQLPLNRVPDGKKTTSKITKYRSDICKIHGESEGCEDSFSSTGETNQATKSRPSSNESSAQSSQQRTQFRVLEEAIKAGRSLLSQIIIRALGISSRAFVLFDQPTTSERQKIMIERFMNKYPTILYIAQRNIKLGSYPRNVKILMYPLVNDIDAIRRHILPRVTGEDKKLIMRLYDVVSYIQQSALATGWLCMNPSLREIQNLLADVNPSRTVRLYADELNLIATRGDSVITHNVQNGSSMGLNAIATDVMTRLFETAKALKSPLVVEAGFIVPCVALTCGPPLSSSCMLYGHTFHTLADVNDADYTSMRLLVIIACPAQLPLTDQAQLLLSFHNMSTNTDIQEIIPSDQIEMREQQDGTVRYVVYLALSDLIHQSSFVPQNSKNQTISTESNKGPETQTQQESVSFVLSHIQIRTGGVQLVLTKRNRLPSTATIQKALVIIRGARPSGSAYIPVASPRAGISPTVSPVHNWANGTGGYNGSSILVVPKSIILQLVERIKITPICPRGQDSARVRIISSIASTLVIAVNVVTQCHSTGPENTVMIQLIPSESLAVSKQWQWNAVALNGTQAAPIGVSCNLDEAKGQVSWKYTTQENVSTLFICAPNDMSHTLQCKINETFISLSQDSSIQSAAKTAPPKDKKGMFVWTARAALQGTQQQQPHPSNLRKISSTLHDASNYTQESDSIETTDNRCPKPSAPPIATNFSFNYNGSDNDNDTNEHSEISGESEDYDSSENMSVSQDTETQTAPPDLVIPCQTRVFDVEAKTRQCFWFVQVNVASGCSSGYLDFTLRQHDTNLDDKSDISFKQLHPGEIATLICGPTDEQPNGFCSTPPCVGLYCRPSANNLLNSLKTFCGVTEERANTICAVLYGGEIDGVSEPELKILRGMLRWQLIGDCIYKGEPSYTVECPSHVVLGQEVPISYTFHDAQGLIGRRVSIRGNGSFAVAGISSYTLGEPPTEREGDTIKVSVTIIPLIRGHTGFPVPEIKGVSMRDDSSGADVTPIAPYYVMFVRPPGDGWSRQ